MPDIEGQSYEEALITLFKAGFTYKNITFYEIEDYSVGYHYVVKTDPKAGDSLSADDKIVVYYSSVRSNETGNDTDNNTNSTPAEQTTAE
jgi:beta-lactam-binding protein with PASTA domain